MSDAQWGWCGQDLFDDVHDLLLLLGAESAQQPVGQHQVRAAGVRQVIESVPVRVYGRQLLFLRRRCAVPAASCGSPFERPRRPHASPLLGNRERSDERVNSRNGYRHRDCRHPGRHLDVAIPKLPVRLVLPGLVAGAAQTGRAGADVGGRDVVPAGCVDPPDGEACPVVGGDIASKSQVSVMARDLDQLARRSGSARLD